MVLANAEGHLAMKCVVRRHVQVVLLIVASKLVTWQSCNTDARRAWALLCAPHVAAASFACPTVLWIGRFPHIYPSPCDVCCLHALLQTFRRCMRTMSKRPVAQ